MYPNGLVSRAFHNFFSRSRLLLSLTALTLDITVAVLFGITRRSLLFILFHTTSFDRSMCLFHGSSSRRAIYRFIMYIYQGSQVYVMFFFTLNSYGDSINCMFSLLLATTPFPFILLSASHSTYHISC